MRSFTFVIPFVATALAARPFLNEPDTGIEEILGSTPTGSLAPLSSMFALSDFDYAARKYLNSTAYTYYRNGAGGEWSYRNNLEVYSRYRLRPRTMVDISNVPNTLSTKILGYNYSAPFFISPCARAGYAHPGAEANLANAAGSENILYIPSQYSTISIEQIGAARNSTSQVTFQQLYLTPNDTLTKEIFSRAEKAGSRAFVYTIDSAADGNRPRAFRYGVGSANTDYDVISWEYYAKIRKFTKLPIILKGIQTVEDARLAVTNKVPGILLSNHGGRQLDGTPSSLEVALEIYQKDPQIFKQIEVYADGGIRQGSDALRLLALGVKAVGIGRPFMYSNIYGTAGVQKAIQMMKREVAIDAGNLGVPDLKKINPSYVNWTPNNWQG